MWSWKGLELQETKLVLNKTEACGACGTGREGRVGGEGP